MVLPLTILIDRSHLGYKGILSSYLIRAKDHCAIVDPGPQRNIDEFAEYILEYTRGTCLVEKILLTHIHLDHAGGAARLYKILVDKYRSLGRDVKVRVVVHPRGKKHIVNPQKLWESTLQVLGDAAYFYGEPENLPENAILIPEDHSYIELGDTRCIKVVFTPGHASHHMSFIIEDITSTLIAGDAAGMYLYDDILPTTPPIFRYDLALESLRKLIAFNPLRIGFAHFGFSGNAVGKMKRTIDTYKYLYNLICEYLRKRSDYTLDELYKSLISENAIIRKWSTYYERLGAPYFKNSLKNSIEGFYRYCLNATDKKSL